MAIKPEGKPEDLGTIPVHSTCYQRFPDEPEVRLRINDGQSGDIGQWEIALQFASIAHMRKVAKEMLNEANYFEAADREGMFATAELGVCEIATVPFETKAGPTAHVVRTAVSGIYDNGSMRTITYGNASIEVGLTVAQIKDRLNQ